VTCSTWVTRSRSGGFYGSEWGFVTRCGREQQERQEQARREYGSEYERLVEEPSSEREAEQQLREHREKLEVRRRGAGYSARRNRMPPQPEL
jgi:hypothetical protein